MDAPLKKPARIAQDPKTHRDLEGVTHHPWVNSYRYYYKLNNRWSIHISQFSFAVAAGETVLGVVTGNPLLTIHGAWGLAANAVCLGINKLSHATIHYTQMAERLYNRKVHIYREILKDPELSRPLNLAGLTPEQQDEAQKQHIDFLIEQAVIGTLSPQERRFRSNKLLRRIFYQRFENRRNVVLGGAIGYQLGTGAYAVLSDATSFLFAYPVRAIFTSMIYWHFKREDAREAGKTVYGPKHVGPCIDAALSAVTRNPARLSIPFEVAAGINYTSLTATDISLGLAAFAAARPLQGTLHMLSALGNAGFIATTGLTVVAEMDQGDGIDWKHARPAMQASDEGSIKKIHSHWRDAIPTATLRRAVHKFLPQVPVDKTLFSKKDYITAPVI